MEDLRCLERFNLRLPSRIKLITEEGRNDNKLTMLKTRNISSGVAFFPTRHPFSEGTDVNIDLSLMIEEITRLASKHVQIRVNGRVIRREQNDMAVIFLNDYVIDAVEKID